MATILVTGIAGGLARRVAGMLAEQGHEPVGVDYRPAAPLEGPAKAAPLYKANYNKTLIEDVFRRHRFEAVLHLGRVGNLKESAGKRFDLNVVGSQKIMNLCLSNGVTRLLVLSTFHIYGAHSRNHIPIYEEEPLRAGFDFPQLADAIQLDNMASTWVYRHPEVRTVVLRPTNVIGATLQNTMTRVLRQARVPYLLGYNPMTQFVDEDDLARAVVATVERREPIGIFNLAGPTAVPWKTAIELTGAPSLPVPPGLASLYLLRSPQFPRYMLRFLMYPCVIADEAFRRTFEWQPTVGLREAIARAVGHSAGGPAPRGDLAGARAPSA